MQHTEAALTLRVVRVVHPVGYPVADAAPPGHYSNHMLDLCRCLMFHGFIKGDESGSQWLERERERERGRSVTDGGKNKRMKEWNPVMSFA